jgi:nucleoside-diphosphate-sugar epimerase
MMRLDRINVPAVALAPRTFITQARSGRRSMRIFVTGASGWIGSAVIPELIGAGHQVLGLARSDASATAVAGLGAEVLRGDLWRNARHAGRPATERDELIAAGPIAARITNMRATLAAADKDVRSCLVMLPRSVHGQGERHGFIPQLIALARAKGVSGYIGDGTSRWPAVHVKDAASLYRLAVEQAPAGAVLNAVGDEGVPVREIAEAIGRHLNLPARSRPAGEYDRVLARLLSTDMPASSTITQELLGWKPVHPGLIEDIDQGHYFI